MSSSRPLHTAPTFSQSVRLVSTREIVARLRSKSFLISTAILLLISVASVVVGGIAAQNTSVPRVAVVGYVGQNVEQTQAFDLVQADNVADAEALVRDGTVVAAVVPASSDTSPLGVDVIALSEPPLEVMRRSASVPHFTSSSRPLRTTAWPTWSPSVSVSCS
ncbi:hypothetical protein [Cryobacterium sp. MLB-32]|uniref:hypothetical protein n=1 Tax=Cryobacterium sp. MLB-32 TaxID=1529318 RepID=UPI0026CD2C36